MSDDFSAIKALRPQATMVDYPGRMAGLVFTAGCNFRCGFCHNPDLLTGGGKTYTWQQLDRHCENFRRQWVEAISISGGEPTLHPALEETIRFFRQHGFLVKLDTNGSRPEILERILPLVDYVAMDVKCSLPRYAELTGFTDTAAVRRSASLIMSQAKDYEFRTTVLENFHSPADVLACRDWLSNAKLWIFQPFIPHENLPDEAMRTLARTRPSFLEELAQTAATFVIHAEAR